MANTAEADAGRLQPGFPLLLSPDPSVGRRSQVLQKLTNDILVMLRDELFPVAWVRRSKVDVDEAITWGVQVGLEREQRVLVGDIFVLGVKVVDELHPWQKA